jgi:general stress protein 26
MAVKGGEGMTGAHAGEMGKVRELIEAVRVAFLTTVDLHGTFHARPVQTLGFEPENTLWFFTDRGSAKVEELNRDIRVSLAYADPRAHVYVAVCGSGTLLRDAHKARQLWSVEQRAFYPQGPEDDRLLLLRVRIERAEYWLTPSRVGYLAAAARAAITGVPAGIIGENHKVE